MSAAAFDARIALCSEGFACSERVLRHEYRQPDDGASSEVDDVVDRDHLQVQHHLLRPLDRPRQDEGGAHVTGLPHVKLSSSVARLDLEDVEGAGVTRGGLHLEDVCRHSAPRRQVHVSVQNGERQVPAGRVLSCTHALIVANDDVRKLTL